MTEEKDVKVVDKEEKKPLRSKKLRALRVLVYTSYLCSLILLIAILLAIVANRKTQPYYSWIENTRFEKIGNFVAGLIIEQKVSMQVDAHNDPLNEDEQTLFEKEMENIPEFKRRNLLKANLHPRDQRLILEYTKLEPHLQGEYLIVADPEAEEPTNFGSTLDKLYVAFIKEMDECGLSPRLNSRPHICFFKNRAEYSLATQTKDKGFHDSLGFFSPVKNCIYFFSRTGSLEGVDLKDKFDERRAKARSIYKGLQLQDYLAQLNLEEDKQHLQLRQDTLCTLRHEGAHQLAHMYGLHSHRGFEKRWLTEGLAQYFETAQPGSIRNKKRIMLSTVSADGKLIPWETLVNKDIGTFTDSPHEQRQLAYSQSWFLTRYLMMNYRTGFFKFIKMKRESGLLDSPQKDFDHLCQLLNVPKELLISQLQQQIDKL